jgi:hypothetical protein
VRPEPLASVRSSRPSSNQKHGLPTLNIGSWLDVLRLSDMWQIQELRAFTIAQLTTLFDEPHADGVVQFTSGTTYHVDDWMLAGLEKLVKRAHPLSAGDMDLIDTTAAAFVVKHRERVALKHADMSVADPCTRHLVDTPKCSTC